MKKLFFALLCIFLFAFLIGCMAESDRKETINPDMTNHAYSFGNEEYNIQTDDQVYYSDHQVVSTPDGYYFFDHNLLCFFDRNSKQSVPVCSKINCDHTDENCDANFDWLTYRTEQGIWYFDGYLYLIGSDRDFHDYVLYRINLDGTNREKICDLFHVEGEDNFLSSFVLHRGYLYYSLRDDTYQTPAILYRIDLNDNDKVKEAYEHKIPFSDIHRIRGYGDGVFFQVGTYSNEELDEYTGSIYYLSHGGEVKEIISGASKNYTIDDGFLYYTSTQEIHKVDLASGDDSVFYKSGRICDISFDNQYIYLDDWFGVLLGGGGNTDKRTIKVFTKEGDFVKSMNIPTKQAENCFFGDDGYLFMLWYIDANSPRQVLKAFDKSQIESGQESWIELAIVDDF